MKAVQLAVFQGVHSETEALSQKLMS